jgi:hypothetical protein
VTIHLSNKWASYLVSQPEAGMGYQIASIVLKDGTKFEKVVVVGGYIGSVEGFSEIPFKEEDIAEIIVTNQK